jgi:hypothetical protein
MEMRRHLSNLLVNGMIAASARGNLFQKNQLVVLIHFTDASIEKKRKRDNDGDDVRKAVETEKDHLFKGYDRCRKKMAAATRAKNKQQLAELYDKLHTFYGDVGIMFHERFKDHIEDD